MSIFAGYGKNNEDFEQAVRHVKKLSGAIMQARDGYGFGSIASQTLQY